MLVNIKSVIEISDRLSGKSELPVFTRVFTRSGYVFDMTALIYMYIKCKRNMTIAGAGAIDVNI